MSEAQQSDKPGMATPRTDAAIERGECGPDLCRKLERELAEAKSSQSAVPTSPHPNAEQASTLADEIESKYICKDLAFEDRGVVVEALRTLAAAPRSIVSTGGPSVTPHLIADNVSDAAKARAFEWLREIALSESKDAKLAAIAFDEWHRCRELSTSAAPTSSEDEHLADDVALLQQAAHMQEDLAQDESDYKRLRSAEAIARQYQDDIAKEPPNSNLKLAGTEIDNLTWAVLYLRDVCESLDGVKNGLLKELAAADARPSQSATPAGWKLVPVEPTPAMILAANGAPLHGHPETGGQHYDEIYQAMLEAAPCPADSGAARG